MPQLEQPVSGSELYDFTVAFFSLFGAQISESSGRDGDQLRVQLPTEMAEHFGGLDLQLRFRHVDQSDPEELVAFGSRTFDRMISYLNGRSAMTVQQLPRRYSGGEELLQALQPVNAGIAGLQMKEEMRRLLAFTWQITYRADDKREELHTVIVDEAGNRFEGELADLFGDAQPVPARQDKEGQLLPAQLPAMTQLNRLAEKVRRYAIYYADLRAAEHEVEILPRLYKALTRLTTYYEQQIQEVYDSHDPAGSKRTILEEDLARKISEEVENHRLRISVRLFGYAIVEVPHAVAELKLSDGRTDAAVQVVRNLYDGELSRPACHACADPLSAVVLDRNGHLVCDDCLRQCAGCQDILCAACGLHDCPVCGRSNCDTCSALCWACGEHACTEHLSTCSTCGDAVCDACQSECAACGKVQCRSHLRADCVPGADDALELICAECAVRCPACRQYSAHVGTCSASGQRFCHNCLVVCAGCESIMGPGFYQVDDIEGLPYCQACLRTCSACQARVGRIFNCSECDRAACPSCGSVCDLCNRSFCSDHSLSLAGCGHTVCIHDWAGCALDGRAVCPLCSPACGICGRFHCDEHAATCLQCSGSYCVDCVGSLGLCKTCATIYRDGEPVKLADEPWASDAPVADMASAYNWVRAGNDRYIIYLGFASTTSGAIVVVELTDGGPSFRSARRMSSSQLDRGRP